MSLDFFANLFSWTFQGHISTPFKIRSVKIISHCCAEVEFYKNFDAAFAVFQFNNWKKNVSCLTVSMNISGKEAHDYGYDVYDEMKHLLVSMEEPCRLINLYTIFEVLKLV